MFLKYANSKCGLTKKESVLLQHGINTIINDSINILSIIILAFLFNDILNGVLYAYVFSSLRRHSGGWHASSRIRCFISYQLVFLIMLFLINTSNIESNNLSIIIYSLSILYILKNAPVEHIYNPLSEDERLKNTRIVMYNIIKITILFMTLYLYHTHYPFVICYASAWNACCMAILKHSKMWRKQ